MGVPKSFWSRKLASKLSYLSLVSQLATAVVGASDASNITNITDISVTRAFAASFPNRSVRYINFSK